MLGIGGFTPLDGFMTRADWQGVCDDFRVANGLFWPIPITLSVDATAADSIGIGDDIALAGEEGDVLAVMKVSEKYSIDKTHECLSVFRTTDIEHPGVKMVMQQGDVNLAGPVQVLSDGGFKAKYGALFMTPAETRSAFEQLGWSRVAAFQTRNPMHRSHEYLAKIAIEVCDGVLVHSLLGNLKAGDIPAEVRTRAIAVLIEKYFRAGHRAAGWLSSGHALRGAARSAVARAVSPELRLLALDRWTRSRRRRKVYGPFDAHRIFDEIPSGSLETQPLKIDVAFWCYACGGMASGRTCPHNEQDQLQVSGTQLRKWLSEGSAVPPEFSRPEVLEILRGHYARPAAHS